MKRDIGRDIDTIDTALTTPALIGFMFLLAFYVSHSLVLSVAVGCVTWAAAWYFWRRGRTERRTGEDRVEIVVAQPPTPADDEAQSPPEAPEEPTSRRSGCDRLRAA
jgi:hypothetical protein